jgi:hypothetical protein
MTEDKMKPNAPTTDVLTLIGMMASITGIFLCLLFLFTPVTFGAIGVNAIIDGSPDLHISMRWIQPILGRAIVEDALLRQRLSDATNAAPFVGESTRLAPGSIQWVVGRVIVELHRSRMVSSLTDGGSEPDDRRIVAIARHAVKRFQEGPVGEPGMRERPTANVHLMFF